MMTAHDLSQHPIWQADELGRPIPASPHAVSVALPRWQDVVGYEEKKPEVVNALTSGYPRFFIHEQVQDWRARSATGSPCLPFPSLRAAQLCAQFVERSSGEQAKVLAFRGVHGVVTSEAGTAALRAFWQHTGLIVSTRQAEAHLAGRAEPPDDWLSGSPCDGNSRRSTIAPRTMYSWPRPAWPRSLPRSRRSCSGLPTDPRPNWASRTWTP